MEYTAVLVWYLWLQAFALGGSLITRRWLRRLPDGGYGAGKAAGLLFGAFFFWIGVTLGLLNNTTGAVLFALVLVWALGLSLSSLGPARIADVFTRPTRAVVITEVLFAAVYLLWVGVRAYAPEITEAGGEKYMESMMINAILRAPSFPPNDAWMTGLPLSYYYFGYIMFAMLIRVSGVSPEIGFNLGGAMIPALAAAGAFCAGYNLWATHSPAAHKSDHAHEVVDEAAAHSRPHHARGAVVCGLAAVILLTGVGNMGGFLGVLRCANALPTSVWAAIDVEEIYDADSGILRQETCINGAPNEYFKWWWNWARAVKDYRLDGAEQGLITETPAFSFVHGDNHPHVIALPFIMLCLCLSLAQFLYRGYDEEDNELPLAGFLLDAIAVGGIGFLNTIDLPIVALAYLAARVLSRHLRGESIVLISVTTLFTLAAAYLFYLPFHVTLSSQVQGLVPNLFNATRPLQFMLHFAALALACAALPFVARAQTGMDMRRFWMQTARLAIVALLLGAAGLAFAGLYNTEAREMAQAWRAGEAILGVPADAVTARLLGRIGGSGLSIALAVLVAACAALLLERGRLAASPDTPLAETRPAPVYFALMLTALGALIVLAVEFAYLRDFFNYRINSVFKFWYQAWALWSIAGAFALSALFAARGLVARAFGALTALIAALGLLFPFYAAHARWAISSAYTTSQPTLDAGIAIRKNNPEDYAIIQWLNANERGAPVLLEGVTNEFASYTYRGRISAYTGLPTLLGWGGHQGQWRGAYDIQRTRNEDVKRLYSSVDAMETRELLRQYKVKYVVVGREERYGGAGEAYPPEGLNKFAELCKSVFTSGESVLYDCQ